MDPVGSGPVAESPNNRTEAPWGLTSGLVPNHDDAGHLQVDTLHTSIAKVDYFTVIRWSN